MTILEQVIVAPQSAKGTEITAAAFGMNLVAGYERFGTKPWEKFDEIQASIGSKAVRFQGGSGAELLFDYANPQATVALDSSGNLVQLIAPDAFLQYCASTGTKATIELPVMQLLTGDRYGARDFDATKATLVRDYVDHLLDTAGPQGIATLELGNEYATYMTSTEYGKVASAVALIAHQEIEKYYAAHPGNDAVKPLVAVQVWGQSTGGTYSLADLASRNQTVMAQFSADELASVTAVTDHFYYDEGANAGKPNYQIYSNIQTSVGYSLDLMNAWSTQTGRSLDTIFSEWNVNFHDAQNYGLKQIPVLLELFTSFVAGGVDQMDFWSTMYNATSLADYQGNLQAAGTLFKVMAQDLIGLQATEVPVTSANYDIHAFSGKGHAVLFVSSLIDDAMTLKMDLSAYLDRYDLTSARLMQVDLTKADGVYKGVTGLAPWAEADAPILVKPQDIAALLSGGNWTEYLGAHETLVLEFTQAPTVLGTGSKDKMTGLATDDRMNALGSNDLMNGMGGNDTLIGGDGNDTILGGSGHDRIIGGTGADSLLGGTGNDTIDGNVGNDLIYGGDGDDYLAGGSGTDRIWGGAGSDAFVFRAGEIGPEIVADFSSAQNDFLVYNGITPVSASDFLVEVRAIHGLGVETTPDLVVRLASTGQVLWQLQDAGNLTSLTLQDADTGTVFALL
jgi:Ca2+-binding RTX toxin-like protein